jgi:hypothetical protein
MSAPAAWSRHHRTLARCPPSAKRPDPRRPRSLDGRDPSAAHQQPPHRQGVNYLKRRWPAFNRFLDDGRVCLSNNAAERALRGVALGRKSWLFAGSDRGGHLMLPILALCCTEDGDALIELPAQIEDELFKNAGEIIPECVLQIAAFWKARRRPPPSPVQDAPRPGATTSALAVPAASSKSAALTDSQTP